MTTGPQKRGRLIVQLAGGRWPTLAFCDCGYDHALLDRFATHAEAVAFMGRWRWEASR